VHGTQAVVDAINRAGAARQVDVDLAQVTGVTFGAALTDRLDTGGRTVPVTNGHVLLDLPARGAMILAP
jgi:hypothetical protein